MSKKLSIHFDWDMPALALDVVAPDLKIVKRLMLSAGRDAEVEVPSDASFLRVHLPSGESAVLEDPGKLERTVSRSRLESVAGVRRSGDKSKSLHSFGFRSSSESMIAGDSFRLGEHDSARLLNEYGNPMEGRGSSTSATVEWEVMGPPFQRLLQFELTRQGRSNIQMCLPGNARHVWVQAQLDERYKAMSYTMRVESSDPVADTILNYLRLGDLAAAETMHGWAAECEELLRSKMQDPYAAAVGAYLLLRLRRFELLHDWPRNLSNWFEFLPDGCVIWAWQLIATQPDNEDEIRKYLLMAANRGAPVYSEGMRLLLDGLNLLGDEGHTALETLRPETRTYLWDLGFTTWAHSSPLLVVGDPKEHTMIDLSYGPLV